MQIPTKDLGLVMEAQMAKEVAALTKKGKKPRLTTILIGSASEQLSFVAIKRKKAQKLGIGFKFIHIEHSPLYEEFSQILRTEAADPKTTGIIVQLPLPATLMSDTLYNILPQNKEIEGHREKSPFLPPIGLAVLTALKYTSHQSLKYEDVVTTTEDKRMISAYMRNRKVVLMGRGLTGGVPIGKTLNEFNIPFVNVSSQTDPETTKEFLQQADVVITATGKKVIEKDMLKPGAILLNVGLREEKGKLKGDYSEREVEDIASFYTKTPGGIGPIDVLYLFRNLIDAAKMQ